ncbi:hypothetical protein HYH03_014771 [Edaphochlamys debaryana]|uniref:Cyclin-like domain-containing protein n=1 Tax=Edaphochlamys debaryana TaxID=47281 RepID=A0A835XM45_9CHLO|nr:hypothetical protein HYH03_014771 [Edaphochlamys debaryana]|eukprot:KAG2486603.1 hypothetical protein HYH03_014771 [Edaphochlamys debaryana]
MFGEDVLSDAACSTQDFSGRLLSSSASTIGSCSLSTTESWPEDCGQSSYEDDLECQEDLEESPYTPRCETGAERSSCTAHPSDLREHIRADLTSQEEARCRLSDRKCQPLGGCADMDVDSSAGTSTGAAWTADRQLLVGWMSQLIGAAGMQRETLFCAADLLDRYVEAARQTCCYPPERLLQLVAMACVSLAMKFEEVAPLPAAVLLQLAVDPADGQQLYRATDLSRMEWLLLETVDWRVGAPTAHSFLTNFLAAAAACCDAGGGGSSSRGSSCGSSAAAPATPSSGFGLCPSLSRWHGALATRATEILDTVLLHQATLPYSHSTLAMACLVLAGPVAAAATASSGRIASSARALLMPGSGAGRAVALECVAHVSGLSLEQLAPGLAECVAALETCCKLAAV